MYVIVYTQKQSKIGV